MLCYLQWSIESESHKGSFELDDKNWHSSRMHTARLLTVSPSMHCTGGSALARGICLDWGGVCQHWGSLPCWGFCNCQGASALPEGVVSQHTLRQCPPSSNRMTDRCKNITLPQTSFAGGKNDLISVGVFWMGAAPIPDDKNTHINLHGANSWRQNRIQVMSPSLKEP